MKTHLIVESILSRDPETRNSDKKLILAVWDYMGLNLSDTQKAKFMDMPPAETIRRLRQKLQERGRYRASDSVRHERYIKSLIMQQNEPKAPVERVETILEQRSLF